MPHLEEIHYDDVIMTMLASQITGLTVVYSIVYSGVNQRKHQSSASLAFVREIHRGISRTNGQLRGKCFHLMTSSCFQKFRFHLFIPWQIHNICQRYVYVHIRSANVSNSGSMIRPNSWNTITGTHTTSPMSHRCRDRDLILFLVGRTR